jgi:glyoxylase-like metal-dependent hydrolase (beta-lactamase superfamily II)
MTGKGTNTYLIGSDELVVIDPGPDMPEHIESILSTAGSSRIVAQLVTHRHSDHLPAALKLAPRTGAPIYGHQDLPGVMSRLVDEQVLRVEDFHLQALHTPGHTPESLSYLLEESRTLFCGDLMAGSGTVIVGSGEGELQEYLASLRRLLAMNLARVLPGHGPPIEDPRAKIQEYLEHRQMREDQVVAALQSGRASVEQLRRRIYPEVPDGLIWAAENNVRTHLLKLRAEARAAERSGTWELRA